MQNPSEETEMSVWLNPADVSLAELTRSLGDTVTVTDLEFAADVQQQVPVYAVAELLPKLSGDKAGRYRRSLQSELVWLWRAGPGIVVFSGAFAEPDVIDRVTEIFHSMIRQARESDQSPGDHFARPGANDRIWNALQKLCVEDPALYARYYSNEILALASEAWLGEAYQVTSQVNCVNPGGEAQVAHRDYHLGFMSPEQASKYPLHAHQLSAVLTLQAAVAHVDMPLESGPTMYLPHSQKYSHGYLMSQNAEILDYFDENRVQLALHKGDLVMFNPALIHAAGHNRSTGIKRMANLLQISSAMGRSIESVDRQKMSMAVYPALQELRRHQQLDEQQLDNVIAATAEGYAFPTNLDHDPPIDGLAPPSQQDVLRQALAESWEAGRLERALVEQAERRVG